MPLSALVQQLKAAPLTAEVLDRARRPDRLLLRGGGRGARSLVVVTTRW